MEAYPNLCFAKSRGYFIVTVFPFVSIATAGQAMLVDVLVRETESSLARVSELVVNVGVGWGSADETRRNGERVADAVANILVDGTAGRRIHLGENDA